MIEERDLVLEDTEKVGEPTTEETVEGIEPAAEQEKGITYTQEELNSKVDELVAKKIARRESKIRREYEQQLAPYKEVERVLNAGMGTSNINEAAASLKQFYEEKGVKIPQSQSVQYNSEDLKVLADNEVQKIIDAGMDEVIDEVDRLAAKGTGMSQREKIIFSELAEYRKAEGAKAELRGMGVGNDVIESDSFQQFASKFNSSTPIKEIYDLYTKTHEKPHIEKMGSMKNGAGQEEKTFYTPDEVDKLTEKDLDDPKIFAAVRNSMSKW